MKQRFSSLDIKVIAHELSKTVTSLRVANIYDLSSRIFLFKFAASGRKEQFVVDSGFRCHLSSYARTTAGSPSAFIARLRKFLRSRRVTKIVQVGTDRILEFEFSDGQYHLFLEFYAGGNVVLTDNEYHVIALQRIVNEGASHEHLRVGLQYNLSDRQNIHGVPPMTSARLIDGLQKYVDRQAAGPQPTNKKLKKKAGDTLRKALAASINEYAPMLLDHSLRQTNFDIEMQPQDVLESEEHLDRLLVAMQEAQRLMDEVMSKDVVTGYIFGKPLAGKETPAEERAADAKGGTTIIYEDFHPFQPKHLAEDTSLNTLEFEGFNHTVDEFFSSIEGQKLESRLAEKEENAKKKLEHARLDQQKRLGGLQQVQEMNVRKAQAIEANLERVQEAIAAVNSLIAQGMDWDEVEKLVELEQRRNNPVAESIKLPLKLAENTVTLSLAELGASDADEDVDEGYESTDADLSDSEKGGDKTTGDEKTGATTGSDQRLQVDVDLGLSPWSNAREYYDQKKSAASKEEKTLQASAKALKSTQRKVEADLKRALKQEKEVLRPVRNDFWFEKFDFFFTSDGYLVLGATDAQQSDLLYRKHLKPGDVWVHADLEKAMPCIVKNRSKKADAPIPPTTLSQAGNLTVATSTAWDSKAVMSAWWVSPSQVSKKTRTGDYLQPGHFEIKGDKIFLPPAQLLLGFAALFQISDASKARHLKHRVQEPDVGQVPSADTQEQDGLTERSETEAEVDANAKLVVDSDQHGYNKDYHDDADRFSAADAESDAGGDEDADEIAYMNPLQSFGAAAGDQTHADKQIQPTHAQDEHEESGLDMHSREVTSEEEPQPDLEEISNTKASNDSMPESANNKVRTSIPIRGKKGKKKKIAQKYADQDEEDREEAMRLLGSAVGLEKQREQATAKDDRERALEAQRQRRREQHQKALEKRAQQEDERLIEEEEDVNHTVDLETLVGTPLPGDEIIEAIPICAPWGALGRYKYKVKLQPGNEKKGKAVRGILAKWGADAANKRNVDEKAEDVERVWPKETELIKSWKEAEIFGVVPVSKVRVMMSGASSGGAKGGGKQKATKGAKKQR